MLQRSINSFLSHQRAVLPLAQSLQGKTFSACSRAFPSEPKPNVKTDFPQPSVAAWKETLGSKTDTIHTIFPVDLTNSLGNIVADGDGNKLLDIFGSIGTNAVGYNHPRMLEAAESDLMLRTLATRTGTGINPIKEQAAINEEAFMAVAPPGMERVTAAMCGTCANEGAFKVAMAIHTQKKRGGMLVEPTPEELCSCLDNAQPGSKPYAILSLNKSFHGRHLGALSASRSKAMQKLDAPAFDWPAAMNPVYKYPLAENADYNREQDRMALEDMRAKIDEWTNGKGKEVVAVIIEPIQSEGGDNYLSNEYARGVRKLTEELGIYMIVDEVQTGVCGTGKFWAHEHWGLETPPDFVTFAKKMLSCGFYHRHDTKMEQPYRHFNTFFGDPVRAQMTAAQNKIIKDDDLLAGARTTGEYLQNRLHELEKKYPKFIQDTRGLATFLSFTVQDAPTRDQLLRQLKRHGVNQGFCGEKAARFRPTLYFENSHVDFYCDALNKACSDLS